MARDGTKIDDLYISLGIDLDTFDTDYATAQKKVKSAVSNLDRENRLEKLKLEVQLAGFDNANTSLKALKLQSESITKQMDNQRNVVKLANLAYDEAVNKYGKTNAASRQMELTLGKERKELALLEKSLRQVGRARDEQRSKYTEPLSRGFDAAALGITAASAASVKLAMSAVESENLFSVSFGNMATSAKKWSKDLRAELGLNEFELRKNAGTWFVMFKSMGLAKDEAFKMSTTLTKLAYDMASFYDLDPKDAFAKLRSGIAGQTEPLQTLGILLDEKTIQQTAYTNGIARLGQELTAQQKVQARYLAILKQTSMAQGDLAATLDSPTNQLRIMKDEVTQLSIEFGMVLLPTIKEFLQSGRDVSGWFSKLSDSSKEGTLELAKWGAEVALTSTAMTGMSMALGLPLPAWAKLAVAITLATEKLEDYIRNRNIVDSYDKNSEVVWNNSLRQWEKRTEQTNKYVKALEKLPGPIGASIQNLDDWWNNQALTGKELDKHEQYITRKAELEKKMLAEAGKVDSTALEYQLRLELDEEFSTAEWKKGFNQIAKEQQDQVNKDKQVADEKAKIAKDLQEKLFKYTHTELETELMSIDKEVQEHKKKYTEIAGLDEWAEQAKAEVRKKYAKEFEDFANSVTDSELQNRLRAIDAEKEAWIKKLGEEVRATEAAEKKKQQAVKDSAMAYIREYKEELKALAEVQKIKAFNSDGTVDEALTKQLQSGEIAKIRQQLLDKQLKGLGIDQDYANMITPKLVLDFDKLLKGAADSLFPNLQKQAPPTSTGTVTMGNIQITIQSNGDLDMQKIPGIAEQVADQVADKIGERLKDTFIQDNQYGYRR